MDNLNLTRNDFYKEIHKNKIIKNISPTFESFALSKTYVKEVKIMNDNEIFKKLVLIDNWAAIQSILTYLDFKLFKKALHIELIGIENNVEYISTENIKYNYFPFGENLYKDLYTKLNGNNLEIISNKLFNVYISNNNTIIVTEKEHITENIDNIEYIEYIGIFFAPVKVSRSTQIKCYRAGTVMYKGNLSNLWCYDPKSDYVFLKSDDIIF